MKIQYCTPPGSPTFSVLADEGTRPLGDAISGFQPKVTKSPQIDRLAGGLAPFVQDVGNGLWMLSFTVDRIHATADAALQYLAEHPAGLNVAANFDLKITVGGRSTLLGNCALTELTPDPHSDQSTKIHYTFTGGTYQTTV